MAKLNKKTGTMSGKLGDQVYSDLNGSQVVKEMPKEYISGNTALATQARAIVSALNPIWRELPEEIQDLWEKYGAAQGSASKTESSQVVSYKCCPIPAYPPRSKKLSGHSAFISCNSRGVHYGFGVRLYPPLDVRIPPAPLIDCKYERSSGELVVWLDTPAIAKPKKRSIYKAIIWLSAYLKEKNKTIFLVNRQKFDVFDIEPLAKRIEKRYSGVEHSRNGFDYKPVRFSQLPYLRAHIGTQLIMVPNELTAPIVSSGNWKGCWILNDTIYTRFEELIEADYIKQVGMLKETNHRFLARMEAKRQDLAKNEFLVVRT